MLETMKRNKILTYAFLMAIPMTTGNIFSSCTDDFEKLNTSNIQVDPADLPFAAQCTEPMTYCYPPQQNMYNPQIQISAESETKRSIFRKRDKTKRSKKESAQHSKSRNKSFVMTSVSAL